MVPVGYGTMRKSNLTGSVSTVKAKDLTPGGSANVQQVLQSWAIYPTRSPNADLKREAAVQST